MTSEFRYTVTIYIAAPGTPLLDKQGVPQLDKHGNAVTSEPGHMFYVLSDGQNSKSFGFAPLVHGSLDGPGKTYDSDKLTYLDPLYARTLEITKAQYDTLNAFGNDPSTFGFDLYYKDIRHNCVDFTWAALNRAGIHREPAYIDVPVVTPHRVGFEHMTLPGSVEGKASYRPAENVEDVRGIRDPIPNSPLNREQTHPMPAHRSMLQHLLSDYEPASNRDVAAVTRHSSIDTMFDALYQASLAQDRTALGTVARAYLQSPDGQSFVQQGRDYNRQLALQTATPQQMARHGPVLSL
ncbi:MAG TPA: hypothetical protein VL997_12060 [Dyella sp.]|nr:hypothetical protein [Dyella sp.]